MKPALSRTVNILNVRLTNYMSTPRMDWISLGNPRQLDIAVDLANFPVVPTSEEWRI